MINSYYLLNPCTIEFHIYILLTSIRYVIQYLKCLKSWIFFNSNKLINFIHSVIITLSSRRTWGVCNEKCLYNKKAVACKICNFLLAELYFCLFHRKMGKKSTSIRVAFVGTICGSNIYRSLDSDINFLTPRCLWKL